MLSDKNQLKKPVKTKTNKKHKTSNVWQIIDEQEKSSQKMELIYEKDNVSEPNVGKSCHHSLYYTDSGFLLCSNTKCERL